MRICFKCGSDNIVIVRRGAQLPITCEDCGAHNGFWNQPMTLALALKFKMPVGQYKGIDLAQIARLDMPYLTWARSNMENKNVVEAIEIVSKHWVTNTKGKKENGN